MFCAKCGTYLDDDTLFCHNCGTPIEAEATNSRRKKQPKPPKKLLSILAVLVAIVLVITAVSNIFVGPSGKLMKALVKSGKAFHTAATRADLTDLADIVTMKNLSVDYDLWLNKLDGMPTVKGLGVRGFVDTSISNKKIAVSSTPYFGSADLITLQMKLDNDKLYAGSPELTEDSYYMLNTATIGSDLEALIGYSDIPSELGFNLFEVISQFEKINSENAKLQKDLKKALRTFAKEIEVEKDGTETVEVNGKDLKCNAYQVTITEDSMSDLLGNLQDITNSVDNTRQYLDLMESIGMPDDVISEIEYSLEDSISESDELFATVDDFISDLGDLELEVYLNDGYIVSVVYESDILNVFLNIGGGKNYVDDISLTFESSYGSTLVFVASGNHAGKGKEFSTNMQTKIDGDTLAKCEISYAPKEKDDNFSFKLTSVNFELKTDGQVDISKNALSIRAEKVKIGTENSFGIDLKLGKYNGDRVKVKTSKYLAEMSENELFEEFTELGENASEMMDNLIDDFPVLQYLFY